jgi:hypothetical protein
MKQLGIITATVLILLTSNAFCQVSQYKVQSLFLYNFTKHIKWQSPTDAFKIGVFGKSDITPELMASMKGKQVEGKNIEVKVITAAEVASCQMVYLPASKSKELGTLLSSITNKEVLLVTEDDLSEKGAAISFLTVDEKLRFKINQDALSKNGLQVSGGLLSLALR